ncbi:hypothetical protein BGZ94_001625 [Podila epigama]|nr:hypothetical protein BGZ94_001625 [Podila epigama]
MQQQPQPLGHSPASDHGHDDHAPSDPLQQQQAQLSVVAMSMTLPMPNNANDTHAHDHTLSHTHPHTSTKKSESKYNKNDNHNHGPKSTADLQPSDPAAPNTPSTSAQRESLGQLDQSDLHLSPPPSSPSPSSSHPLFSPIQAKRPLVRHSTAPVPSTLTAASQRPIQHLTDMGPLEMEREIDSGVHLNHDSLHTPTPTPTPTYTPTQQEQKQHQHHQQAKDSLSIIDPLSDQSKHSTGNKPQLHSTTEMEVQAKESSTTTFSTSGTTWSGDHPLLGDFTEEPESFHDLESNAHQQGSPSLSTHLDQGHHPKTPFNLQHKGHNNMSVDRISHSETLSPSNGRLKDPDLHFSVSGTTTTTTARRRRHVARASTTTAYEESNRSSGTGMSTSTNFSNRESIHGGSMDNTSHGRDLSDDGTIGKKVIIHQVAVSDTLAGIALYYGIQVPILKKSNKLWTNDSIHTRKYLYIPIDECSDVRQSGVMIDKESNTVILPQRVKAGGVSGSGTPAAVSSPQHSRAGSYFYGPSSAPGSRRMTIMNTDGQAETSMQPHAPLPWSAVNASKSVGHSPALSVAPPMGTTTSTAVVRRSSVAASSSDRVFDMTMPPLPTVPTLTHEALAARFKEMDLISHERRMSLGQEQELRTNPIHQRHRTTDLRQQRQKQQRQVHGQGHGHGPSTASSNEGSRRASMDVDTMDSGTGVGSSRRTSTFLSTTTMGGGVGDETNGLGVLNETEDGSVYEGHSSGGSGGGTGGGNSEYDEGILNVPPAVGENEDAFVIYGKHQHIYETGDDVDIENRDESAYGAAQLPGMAEFSKGERGERPKTSLGITGLYSYQDDDDDEHRHVTLGSGSGVNGTETLTGPGPGSKEGVMTVVRRQELVTVPAGVLSFFPSPQHSKKLETPRSISSLPDRTDSFHHRYESSSHSSSSSTIGSLSSATASFSRGRGRGRGEGSSGGGEEDSQLVLPRRHGPERRDGTNNRTRRVLDSQTFQVPGSVSSSSSSALNGDESLQSSKVTTVRAKSSSSSSSSPTPRWSMVSDSIVDEILGAVRGPLEIAKRVYNMASFGFGTGSSNSSNMSSGNGGGDKSKSHHYHHASGSFTTAGHRGLGRRKSGGSNSNGGSGSRRRQYAQGSLSGYGNGYGGGGGSRRSRQSASSGSTGSTGSAIELDSGVSMARTTWSMPRRSPSSSSSMGESEGVSKSVGIGGNKSVHDSIHKNNITSHSLSPTATATTNMIAATASTSTTTSSSTASVRKRSLRSSNPVNHAALMALVNELDRDKKEKAKKENVKKKEMAAQQQQLQQEHEQGQSQLYTQQEQVQQLDPSTLDPLSR